MDSFQKTGRSWLLLMVVFILLGSSVNAQQIKLIKNNPDGSQTLLNHLPKAVASGMAQKMSLANPGQMLDLRIILPSRDQAGMDNFINQLHDRKSANYHKFLTPSQFGLLYGASATDTSAVLNFLKTQGLVVKKQSNNGLILSVTAPVSTVENVFKLHIQNFKNSDGTTFFAPDANPTIPTQLAGKIIAVVGMDNVPRFHPHLHRLPQLPAGKAKPKGAVSPEFSGPSNTIEPIDIINAFNLNAITSTGVGQTLGLYELDGYTPSDITTYETMFSLPNVTLTNVYTDGATGAAGTSTSEDVADIDLSIAIAPGLSKILVYEAPNTGAGWIDQWDKIASDDLAKVISCSWGGDEASQYLTYDHSIFAQLAAQGQTVFAASGDAGAYDNCDGGTLPPNCKVNGVPATGVLSVDDPASDPYVTGVGISVLSINSNGSYKSETASLYGGGGISSYWPIPSYQQGLNLASGSMVSTTMRNVPDLVFTADPSTSYYIYITDPVNGPGWYALWGSSIASPIWAAYMSRVNQGRLAAGETVVGNLNPALYSIGEENDGDFNDLTIGSNSYYPAKAGYDDATGLGSFVNANDPYQDLVGSELDAPLNLAATASVGQITLNWTAVYATTYYNIKRAITSGGPYTTISTSGSVTNPTYIDSTVASGITYYYVVSAVNSFMESGNSNEASASQGPPAAPLGLTTTPGNSEVLLNWMASNTATSYNVKRSLANGGPYVTISSNGTVTSPTYTDNGLTNGRTYYYVVSAVNGFGEGANSAQASAVPRMVPVSPANLKVTILGAKVGNNIITAGLSLTWTQSTNAGIIQNKIYRAVGSGTYSLLATIGPSTSYLDKNVSKGTTYNYEVTAVNSLGESLPSNSGIMSY